MIQLHTGPEFDKAVFREGLSRFASGVTVVTAAHEDIRLGMTVSAFSSVSLEPKKLVFVCLTTVKPTTEAVRSSGWFAVNVLADHQRDVSEAFAWREVEERFDGIGHVIGPRGLPLLTETLATFVCKVDSMIEAGDHVIFVGEAIEGRVADGAPLVYSQGEYHRLGDIL